MTSDINKPSNLYHVPYKVKTGIFTYLFTTKRIFTSRIIFCIFTIITSAIPVAGQMPDLSKPSFIAPAFFGPNALPVPEMPNGRIEDKLTVEIAGDYYSGFYKDQTYDIFARIRIPLFTRRVNLTVWMPIIEFYTHTPECISKKHIDPKAKPKGYEFGDVYISTNIQLFYEKRFLPDVAIEVALKTASGGGFNRGRFFDNPGYYFNASAGKTIARGTHFFKSLRIAASIGFLCWQTDNGRQNDAVTYGGSIELKTAYFSLTETINGYTGWEHCGDSPLTLTSRINIPAKNFSPYIQYQYGFKDYPFHQIRIGITYKWDCLQYTNKRNKK